MSTIYDWLTVLTFCGLAVLFLQRSAADEPQDEMWQYLPPAVGCMLVNYVGNEGQDVAALAGLAAVIAYIYFVLKPRLHG